MGPRADGGVVGHEDKCLPLLAVQAHQEIHDLRRRLRVQVPRRLVRTDPEAKALGDPRAVLKALGVAGFEKRDATRKTFPVRFTSVAELVVFAGSYGWYERELREMTIESRKTFDEELAIRLKPLTTSAGIEDTWTLNLFVARSE